jgi:hypothetical protein
MRATCPVHLIHLNLCVGYIEIVVSVAHVRTETSFLKRNLLHKGARLADAQPGISCALGMAMCLKRCVMMFGPKEI